MTASTSFLRKRFNGPMQAMGGFFKMCVLTAKALGIRALAGHRSMETRNWLLARVAGSKVLMFRRSLASKSPEMLAALAGLSAHWSSEPAAKEVLAQAAKQSDPEIADAAARRGGTR